ncbi:MAG: DUF3237 domain-containing protein [Oceanospirillaceae bacterium]|nr:DUF3237 domain-containing protein [Oceanospirillaceae bacterium]
MFDSKMEHVCRLDYQLAEPEIIGPVGEGLRIITPIAGGEVSGLRLNGKICPTGADWALIRRDGVVVIDVRATLETNDGALIQLTYTGRGDLGEGGYESFLRGDPVPVTELQIVPVMQCAHPDYLWLDRPQFVGVGAADLANLKVSYDIYKLS